MPGRLVGGVYAAAAGILIVAVLAVAYGSAAPTLGVAEFAPAARQAVESPPTTAADLESGNGGGAGRRGAPTTTRPVSTDPAATATSSAAPTTRVARARACVGNPPRQIEDPMSPPCVTAIFEGDNGGATSGGVSSTEIRVGVPANAGFVSASPGAHKLMHDAVLGLFEFVNQRFEFYGRKLVPVMVAGSATDAVSSRVVGAETVASGVFAALTAGQEMDSRNPQAALVQELARAGVVTMVRNAASWWTDRTMFDPYHPYVWSVYPSSEEVQRNLGAVACQLAGKPASYRPGGGSGSPTRRFAIAAVGRQAAPSVGVLSEAIEACTGSRPGMTSAAPADTNVLRTGAARLAADGATTVICVCEGINYGTVMSAFHGAGFDPEWVMTASNSWASEHDFQAGPRNGGVPPPVLLEAGPRLLPVQSRPWLAALLATSPQLIGQGALLDQQYVLAAAEFFYSQLLMLAAGVQGAGPTLTPATFAAGLMATSFPNPGAGQGPYWQPSVGFGPGDHALYDDFAVGWWSDAAPVLDPFAPRPTGSWCFVEQGARFSTASGYPADLHQRLFDSTEACR